MSTVSWKAKEGSCCSWLVFGGTSQRGHTERTQAALQECRAIFRLFVLMLCHRPVYTQAHTLSLSALTLSGVSSTAEVRGDHVSPYASFVAKAPWCVWVSVCVCKQSVPDGVLTVGPSLDSQVLSFPPLVLYFLTHFNTFQPQTPDSCTTPSFLFFHIIIFIIFEYSFPM